MDTATLRTLYDHYQRETISESGFSLEQAGRVVRQISQRFKHSWITYATLDAECADAVIAEQIAYFERIGHHFEWKYYDYDPPEDLLARLEKHGFVIEEAEAIMALELAHLPEKLRQPIPNAIRQLSNTEQVLEMMSVQRAVWGGDFPNLSAELCDSLQNYPDKLSIYAAYADNRPVAAAWIRYTTGSPFASLWGGSTLPEYRQQGYFTQLVAVRVQEALRRGYQYVTVDASPMSRPHFEKFGFQLLGLSHPCKWTLEGEEA